jgi:hypothetical protein
MARKAGQIIARGQSTWLVRVYLGRDPQTGTRKYHNQTIHGPSREAQRFLNLKLQQRDNGRVSRVAVLSLNQLLDQWLTTVVKARVRTRTFKDYEALGGLDFGSQCDAIGQELAHRVDDLRCFLYNVDDVLPVASMKPRNLLLMDGCAFWPQR